MAIVRLLWHILSATQVILILEGEDDELERNELYVWKRLRFKKPVPKGTRIVAEYRVDLQDFFEMYVYLKDDPDVNQTILGRQSISPDDIEKSRKRLALPSE